MKHTIGKTFKHSLLVTTLIHCLLPAMAQAEDSLTVVAQPQESTGLAALQSQSANKSATPLLETPQSVSLITRQQIDLQNARSLNEALRYTPGVAAEQRGGVTAFDQFSIRGFNYGSTGFNDQFLDGLRMNNGLVYGVQQVDPFLLEEIDVLRGPSSVLYGLANPGGVVAMTSKLPTRKTVRHIELEGGTQQYQRGSFDFGGIANDEGTLLYRLAGTATTREGQERGTEMRRYAIAPSITFQPNVQNKLTLYARFQNDPKMAAQTSLPVQGTVKPNPNGKLPVDAYPGEPDHNTFKRKQAAVGYSFEHFFNEDWSTTFNGRYTGETAKYSAVIFAGLEPDMRTITRSSPNSDEHFNTLNLDNQLHGNIDTGAVNHNILLGVSWDRFTGHANYASGPVSTLDIYDPQYGNATIGAISDYQNNRVMNNQTGIYAQDQLSYQNWRATLGIRHDWSSISTTDYLPNGKNFLQRNEATTFRAGINYLFNNGIAPYVTYAQSFQPVNQLDSGGAPFEPSRGELYEAGVKYQPKGYDALFSAAVFNLTQDKVLTTDQTNFFYSVQGGKIRSRGVELEARGQLSQQFSVIGAYTWQNVEYTQDSVAANIGKTPLRIPTHFGSLWVNWEAPASVTVSGLGAGLGGRFSNGTKGGTMDNQFNTAGYGVVDAEVHYDLGKLSNSMQGARVQLTAQNLLDRKYVTSCFSESQGCFYGAERAVIAKLTYDF